MTKVLHIYSLFFRTGRSHLKFLVRFSTPPHPACPTTTITLPPVEEATAAATKQETIPAEEQMATLPNTAVEVDKVITTTTNPNPTPIAHSTRVEAETGAMVGEEQEEATAPAQKAIP